MITLEAAQEACEALGHVALKNLRNQPHLNILKTIYTNCLPSMMKDVVYEMAVNAAEIDSYLVTQGKPFSRLEYAQHREILLEACRQLSAKGFIA